MSKDYFITLQTAVCIPAFRARFLAHGRAHVYLIKERLPAADVRKGDASAQPRLPQPQTALR